MGCDHTIEKSHWKMKWNIRDGPSSTSILLIKEVVCYQIIWAWLGLDWLDGYSIVCDESE